MIQLVHIILHQHLHVGDLLFELSIPRGHRLRVCTFSDLSSEVSEFAFSFLQPFLEVTLAALPVGAILLRVLELLLQSLQLPLELQDELLELLHLHASLLHLDLEVDVLLERSIYLVRSELSESFLEKVDLELDVKVLFLQAVNVLHE